MEDISSKAEIYLREIHSNGRSKGASFDLNRAGLLVLDMQNYFLDPDSHAFIPSAAAIIQNIKRLVRLFLQVGRPVVFTRHGNTEVNAGNMASWWDDILLYDTPAHAIIQELGSCPCTVLDKVRYDAFHGTELAHQLRADKTTQLVITGVMTHLCVESTARSAFINDFSVFLPIDATATYTEAFHRASMLNLSHGFARIVTTDELILTRESNSETG